VRILVVDDHEVVRKGVIALLASRSDWTICGEAADGREAVAAVARLRPDVVLMDISMPGMNGLEAVRQIRKCEPRIEVLILTMHDSDDVLADVLDSGARGYISKSDAAREIVAAVETVAAHKPYYRGATAAGMVAAQRGACRLQASPLTGRERQIVQLVAEGKSSKEIAALLNISVKTVETHRAHVATKLELHSVTDLVRYAIRKRIIPG
jgi:DNA-binding NarL/FixJ family response regulator